MNRQILVLSSFLIGFFGSLANAQTEQRNALLHLDKPFYVSGELIQYTLHLPSFLAKQELIIKSILINEDEKIIDYHFLASKQTLSVQGYYKIPFDLQAAWYQLSFSVLDEASQTEKDLLVTALPIYSDLKPISKNQKQVTSLALEPSASSPDLTLSIKTDQTTYRPRENVAVDLALTDKNGDPLFANISVSIFDQKIVGKHGLSKNNFKEGNVYKEDFPAANTLYEFGQVFDQEGNPLQANLLGAYTRLDNRFTYSKANTDGQFCLQLPPFEAQQSVQFIDYEQEEISVQLETQAWKIDPGPLPYTAEIMHYLDLSRSRKKIYQLYGDLEYKLVTNPKQLETQAMTADQSYVMADYDPFPTVGDFFRELKTPLQYRIIKGKMKARMFNPATQWHNKGKVIFNIDGYLTRNDQYAASLSLEDFRQIDLYFDSKQLREKYLAIGIDGMVTLHPTESIPELPEKDQEDIFYLNGFLPEQVAPENSDAYSVSQPIFKPLLHWNPQISTDPQGKCRFEFQQSDDLSTYRIQVVAQTKDGRRVVEHYDYQVKLEALKGEN